MSKNEWIVDSGCTHHMAKDSSLFSSLNISMEKNIDVANYFSIDITKMVTLLVDMVGLSTCIICLVSVQTWF